MFNPLPDERFGADIRPVVNRTVYAGDSRFGDFFRFRQGIGNSNHADRPRRGHVEPVGSPVDG